MGVDLNTSRNAYVIAEYFILLKNIAVFDVSSSIYSARHWLILGVAAIAVFVIRPDMYLFDKPDRQDVLVNPFTIGIAFSLSVLFFAWSETFIYFRF